jgi:hypothetical protein
VFDGGDASATGASFDADLYSLVAHGRGETGEVARYSLDASFHAKGVTHDTALDR